MFLFFQAEDGIRDLVRSRGLGDVYKRQAWNKSLRQEDSAAGAVADYPHFYPQAVWTNQNVICLLYTSDAADERSSVDLGGRRIIKKKKKHNTQRSQQYNKNTKKSQQVKMR